MKMMKLDKYCSVKMIKKLEIFKIPNHIKFSLGSSLVADYS